mgnify:CR=1 FL=1
MNQKMNQRSRPVIYTGVAAILLYSVITLLNAPETAVPAGDKPNEWFFMQRAYPYGEINHEAYVDALSMARSMKKQMGSKDSAVWEFAGPLNIGGRLTDVEMHPSDMQTIYAGAASGGVFKSGNSGLSWTPVFDDALSLSVGDIAIAPSDAGILYVGTGEANAGGGSLAYDGVGIYRSNNGGNTWEYAGLPHSRNIGRMVIHPQDPDVVYVAAMGSLFSDSPERGIYRTLNGGDSWEKVLYVSDSTGGIDVCLNPVQPDTVYAALWERVRRPDRRSYGGPTCGIYRSYDGGDSWTELSNGLPSPSPNAGRIGIDISRSDPNILYAIYADKTGYFDGVFKTDDHGDSWTQTNDGALSNSYASYGWWFGRISVDPVDPDIAFVIGFDLYGTADGGASWTNISWYNDIHVDQHGMYIHPANHQFAVLGNDGGLYISQDGGDNWSWINNLPVTQFYTCEVDEQFPQRLYGGAQDNGTNRTMNGGTSDWENIYWGDGFYVLVDPLDNSYVYAEYQYGNFARSTNGGNSFTSAMSGINPNDRKNWNTPVVFDPGDPQILYYGANRLYRSENRASSWSAISPDLTNGPGQGNLTYGTITTIGVSPVNTSIIYAGTDDANVWVSTDYGNTWENISTGLPDRWVTRVVADPSEELTAYVTLSGYRYDEFLPHIYRTTDAGLGWTAVSGNLPEAPVNDLIIDPEDNNVLYAATDAGVFVSRDLGLQWEWMGSNLPLVPVCDLDLHNPTRKLIAGTYGRSMYTYNLYQDTVTTSIKHNPSPITGLEISVAPNPASDRINIETELAAEQFVVIEILSISGEQRAMVFEGSLQTGKHAFTWNRKGSEMDRGLYICRIRSEGMSRSVKLVITGN